MAEQMGWIYLIEHKTTGRYYVGQTVCRPSVRWQNHCVARKSAVYAAISLFGRDDFEFSVLERAEIDVLNAREIYWIGRLNCIAPAGFNRSAGAGASCLPASRAKISAANKGRKFTVEHRAKLAAAKLGVKGRKQSPEWIAKRMTAETKAKMSAARRGVVNSPESYAKGWETRRQKMVGQEGVSERVQ